MRTLRTLHPLAWTIIIGTLFARMSTSMSLPFLAIYLTTTLGATPTATGVTVAVSSLVGVFASFYGGYVSDKIGKQRVMLIAIVCWTIVWIAFAGATAVWMFFVLNMLNGICRSLFEPASRALLSDVTPPEQKVLVFNLRYTAVNLGIVVGPLLGVWMGSSTSGTAFLVAGGIYLIYSLILVLQFRRYPAIAVAQKGNQVSTTITMRKAMQAVYQDSVFRYVLLGMIFAVLGYGHLNSTLPQYMALLPNLSAGEGSRWFAYMLTLNAITVLMIQYPLIGYVSHFSPAVSLITGNVLICIGLVLYGMCTSLTEFLIVTILFTMGEVLLFTMMDVFIDRIAQPEWKGTYFGTIGFNNLGNVLAPIMGGMLLDRLGATQGVFIFLWLAIGCAPGIPLFIAAYRYLLVRQQKESS
ncbi:MDR family MFS transporter [Paenibacillus sp. WLX1005]|uniref:MDR family MFS transporter n=1 Tax=Paenibacillus sp. WLX1005 TaxID=3243766 RepID=UPI003983FE4A